MIDREKQSRLKWINLYKQTGNISLVSRRCGVSRTTRGNRLRRYGALGDEGLTNRSRRPKSSPLRKTHEQEEKWILDLRKERKMGARRIQNELKRLYEYSLSLDSIHKVLTRNNVKPLSRWSKRSGRKRYQRPIPGDRVQMDTRKISRGIYQYTAIDDCTRYRVLAVYPRRAASYTLQFLDKVFEERPFPIQRIQTDRGLEFFATTVQKKLMESCIKFRPIRPGSPHLNGKVDRSQKTDLEEFYSTIEFPCANLEDRLREWQHFYNWQRPHGALAGKSSMEKYFEVNSKTPFSDEVERQYEPSKERIQEVNHWKDLQVRRWQ